MLYQFSRKYNKNSIGLYRNDGVAVLKNISVPQAEKIKKHFKSILRKNNLNMIMKCNLTLTRLDFLRVVFSGGRGRFDPTFIIREDISNINVTFYNRLNYVESEKNAGIICYKLTSLVSL